MTLREEIEKLRDELPSTSDGFYGTDHALGRLAYQVAMHKRLTEILKAHPTVPVPDWSEVPAWAMWVAVDAGGEACAFGLEPALYEERRVWEPCGRYESLKFIDVPLGIDWRTLKWERPEKAQG